MNVKYSQAIIGGAALVLASTFVIGFVLFLGFLANSGFESSDPVEVAAFLAEHQTILNIWHLIIYVLFGIVLVILALGLFERLKSRAPAIAQTATAFGLIWAGLVIASGMIAVVGIDSVVDLYHNDPEQAGTAWTAISSVQFGLGGGVEIVGALWVMLVGLSALRAGELSRPLNYLGVAIGVSGVLTVVPALEIFGAVFGLGLIVWFTWLGLFMVRSHPDESEATMSVNVDPRFV